MNKLAAELWTKHTDELRKSHARQWKTLKTQLPVAIQLETKVGDWWREQGHQVDISPSNYGVVNVNVFLRKEQGLKHIVPFLRRLRALPGAKKRSEPSDSDSIRYYFYGIDGVSIQINVYTGGSEVCKLVEDLDAKPVYPTKIVCDEAHD